MLFSNLFCLKVTRNRERRNCLFYVFYQCSS